MAAQSFHCVLCQDSFPSVEEFNLHEKEAVHRKEFERRMDGTSIGLLLCKCCFISVPDLRTWNEHIKSKGHVKLVTQSEYLGKRCVWSVPGVKMNDGSIKLCKDLDQLFDSGWRDPEYVHKLTNMSVLETDVIVGMNCVTLKSMVNGIPLYHCSLCCVDFHHNDRNHIIGRHHKINVIWNWEKKTADRVAKGLDFPKPSTRAKALTELEEVTKKIFKLEQDCLSDEQYELYLVMSSKKLPSDLGKTPVKRRPRTPPAEDRPHKQYDQITRLRSRTPSEPPSKKPRDAADKQRLPPTTTTTPPVSTPPPVSSSGAIQQHQAITIPPPMPPPQPTPTTTPSDNNTPPPPAGMPAFSSSFPEPPQDDLLPEIRAEVELFDLMEELQLSGNFKPPVVAADPTKLLNMLYTLGEGLLEFQTKKREIPMELPRDEIKSINTSISDIEELVNRLSDVGEGDKAS